MRVVFIIGLITVLLAPYDLKAQDFGVLQPGDTLLPRELVYMNNPDEKTGNIADYRGQLLVLYFWSTYCKACLSSFPKLEAINRKFQGKMTVLPVAGDPTVSAEQYEKFYRMRRERNLPITIRSVLDDGSLVQNFPYFSLPYIVWIDEEGRVLQVGAAKESLSETQIQQMIDRADGYVPNKGAKAHIEPGEMLASGDEIYKSSLSPLNPSLKGSGNLFFMEDSVSSTIVVPNCSLASLYRLAYEVAYPEAFRNTFTAKFTSKGILLETDKNEVEDIRIFNLALSGEVPLSELTYYCYELRRPKGYSKKEMAEQMIADLDQMFGVRSAVEKRRITTYDLQLVGDSLLCKTLFSEARGQVQVIPENGRKRIWLTNASIASFVTALNQRFEFPFIVDSTGLSDRIDVDIELNAGSTLAELTKALWTLGFTLEKHTRLEPVLLITDN